MIVALSGASGFVGSHLTQCLREEGYTVRPLIHARPIALRPAFRGNVVTGRGLASWIDGADVLVNLVGRFFPPFSTLHKLNALAVHTLCEAAVRHEVKKIVHVSAAAVYGGGAKPHKETDAVKPTTAYGLTKQLGETVLQYFYRQYGLSYVILRPTNIYGPGNTLGVIARCIADLQKSNTLHITGDGQNVRDFVHVADVVRAISLVVRSPLTSDIINISSGHPVRILDLAKMFHTSTGTSVPIVWQPKASGYERFVAADNTKAYTLLGWKPRITIRKGIKELLS